MGSIRDGLAPVEAPPLGEALSIANAFLGQWNDPLTRSERRDLGLQAALTAIEGWSRLRDKRCFPAFVRTITRRSRANLVRESVYPFSLDGERVALFVDDVPETAVEPRWFPVAGAWVCDEELVEDLPTALRHLSQLNERLLMGYYEGFSCLELAVRYDVTVQSVKVRVHRSRRRVRGLLEARARKQERHTRVPRGGGVPRRRSRR